MPLAMFRSANSVTTMAPSTSIPTARIKLNKTTMFMVRPRFDKARMPSRNEPGMAMPTKPAERKPRAAMMITMTSRMALVTLFCRSLSMVRMRRDSSLEKLTVTPSGQSAVSAATTARTFSLVSMMFSPMRLETSMASAGLPFRRATRVRSFRTRRTIAKSPMRTTASPLTLTGWLRISAADLNRPGTLIGKLPVPLSNLPAATKRLERLKICSNSTASNP